MSCVKLALIPSQAFADDSHIQDINDVLAQLIVDMQTKNEEMTKCFMIIDKPQYRCCYPSTALGRLKGN